MFNSFSMYNMYTGDEVLVYVYDSHFGVRKSLRIVLEIVVIVSFRKNLGKFLKFMRWLAVHWMTQIPTEN